MRRFRTAHEGILADDNVLALWRCDDATNATLADSAYSATFALASTAPVGGPKTLSRASLFDGQSTGAGVGALTLNSAGAAWAQSVAGAGDVAKIACQTNWSLAMWVGFNTTNRTTALFEFSSTSTIVDNEDYMLIGVYRNADGTIRIAGDRTAATTVFAEVDVGANTTTPFHLGIRRDVVNADGAVTGITTARFSLFINGEPRGTAFAPRQSVGTSSGASGRFVLGASRRFGTGSGNSPAFAGSTTSVTMDDVAFFTKPLPDAKFAEIYRNGLRGWDEREMFESGSFRAEGRVLVEDGDGQWVDLSTLHGNNWIRSIEVSEDVEDASKSASFEVTRRFGDTLDASFLAEDSQVNLNDAETFEALFEIRRKVRIEGAYVPREWRIRGWEYVTEFEGFITGLSVDTDRVSVKCGDKMLPLKVAFQIDPKSYDYYDGEVLAEEHLQAIIDHNTPRVFTGDATLTFEWLGKEDPVVVTPASSGWILRYDDTPAANVDKLLTAVADQIGWDLRYRWNEPLQTHQLEFYEPPRGLYLDVARITNGPSGEFYIVTTVPHRLVKGQTVFLTNSAVGAADGTHIVSEVVNDRTIRAGFDTPSHGTGSDGRLDYDAVYTLKSSQIRRVDPVQKDDEDIRNMCLVRYGRDGSSATIKVTVVGTAGSTALVQMSATDRAHFFPYFETGQSFTIANCTDGDGNGDYTIASVDGLTGIVSSQLLSSSISTTGSAIFSSEYTKFKSAISVSTPSVARYGLAAAAVFEESAGNIDTEQEALRLARAVTGDLANPTVDTQVTLPAVPWFELHDLLGLAPDVKGRWSADLEASVVSVAKTFKSESSEVRLGLRKAQPTKGKIWFRRLMVNEGRPARPVKNPAESTYGAWGGKVNTTRGGRIETTWQSGSNANGGFGGKRRQRHDQIEIHLGTDPDFVVTDTTLSSSARNNLATLTEMPDGTELLPGQQVYIKIRSKDIYGNYNLPSAATAVMVRFTSEVPNVFASRIQSSGTCAFRPSEWTAFPFNDVSSSPGTDRYGNFTLGPTSSACIPWLADGDRSGCFQMPCNGVVKIDARVGLWNSVSGTLPLETTFASVGILRLDSTFRGSSATVPLWRFTEAAQTGETGAVDLLPDDSVFGINYFYRIAGTAGSTSPHSAVFFQFTRDVSANSGDYVAVGIDKGIGTGLSPVRAGTTSSMSSSWVRFAVKQI